jgi:hypothetical protein
MDRHHYVLSLTRMLLCIDLATYNAFPREIVRSISSATSKTISPSWRKQDYFSVMA